MPDYYRNSKKKTSGRYIFYFNLPDVQLPPDPVWIGSSPLSVRYIFIFSVLEATHPENEYWHENHRKTAYWKKLRNGIK